MKNRKRRLHTNNLFFRIICTVVIGIFCLVTALCVVNVKLSKEIFIEGFAESQEKIFSQIDSEFYTFYRDLASIMEKVSVSESFRDYMTNQFENQVEERGDILAMEKLVEESEFAHYTELNMFLVSLTGKTYIYNSSDKMAVPVSELLSAELSHKVLENPQMMFSQYQEKGFTDIMKNDPVIVFAKALREAGSSSPEGILYITIKESDFRKMYGYFTSSTSEILIFNQNQELLSSSDPSYFDGEKIKEAEKILERMEKKSLVHMTLETSGEIKSYQIQRLQNTDYKMLGILNPQAAFDEKYHLVEVLLLTALITLLVAWIIYHFLRAETRPLYHLTAAMEKVGEGNLEEYATVEGTDEVRQLSQTYNRMMQEINHYIEEIYRIEKDKRTAEIHALQMQINPHYMYNTLASIKWLAWQGDIGKTTKVIDSFIYLLRNTISNTDEFITVDQEIENLKNYVLINQMRYGDNISVEHFVAPRCGQYRLPKLILQPFVENAFFHAFPEGRKGAIQVFVKKDREYLRFDVMDNGVGMDQEKLLSLKKKENQKGEHFTGIGVNNVDDRIKMIYGMDYGINIISEEGKGTTVTVLLPLR